jgi:hypothetical protein
MFRKLLLFCIISLLTAGLCSSQAFVKTTELFKRAEPTGKLNIIQDQAIDTLLSRYILAGKKERTMDGSQGMQGFRIQIYYSSVRSASEESAKAAQKFYDNFPDINCYTEFQKPGWYMVRVGDYRSKTECYKALLMIKKEFPEAYAVPAVINFPDLIKK